MTINELRTAYKVVTKIMEENHLTKDNSFNRVKNFISNKICDTLIDETKIFDLSEVENKN